MRRFFFLSFAMLSFTLLGAFFTSSSASAATVWDGELVTTDTLELRSPDGTHQIVITDDYMSYIQPEERGCTIPLMENINSANDTGASFMINRHLQFGTLQNSVYAVYGQPSVNTRTEFITYQGLPYVNFVHGGMTDTAVVSWHINNLGTVTASCASFSNLTYLIAWSQNNALNDIPYLYYSTFPIDYPLGYDGEIVPTAPSSATEVYPIIGITVKDAVDNLSDVLITAQPRTWESRGIPPPDFTVITLEDSDNNIVITDGCYGGGRHCDYKKLPLGIYTAYLNVVYTDPDIISAYDFMTTKFVFEVHAKGYTILYHPDDDVYCSVMNGTEWNCDITQPDDPDKEVVTGYGAPLDWYQCVKPEFPYVDIEDCTKNIFQIINILSFDRIILNNDWSINGCHTLGTVGDWLNLENSARTVCPQFSNSVRNIITPFVTFFLATVTIAFVIKRSEGEL